MMPGIGWLDRATQQTNTNASGILVPRFRGDDT